MKSRKSLLFLVFGAVLVLLGSVLGWLWLERIAVAEEAIARALAARGVSPVSFRVTFVGLRSISLADIEIGDGDAGPDVVVDEVSVAYSAGELVSGRVQSIDVGAAKLRLRIGEDGVSFGALDPLVKGEGRAGTLSIPAINVADAEIEMGTTQGDFLLSGPLALDQTGSRIEVLLSGLRVAEMRAAPRVAPVLAAGVASLDNGVVDFALNLTSDAEDEAVRGLPLGHAAGSYDLAAGNGAVKVEGAFNFARDGATPQLLAPVLAPLYLDVTGGVGYVADVSLSEGVVTATGEARLDRLALNQTAAGSFSFSGPVTGKVSLGGAPGERARLSLGGVKIDDLIAPQRLAPVRVEGDAVLSGSKLDWNFLVRSAVPAIAGARLASLTGNYDLSSSKGGVRASGALDFTPGKLELQTVLPLLRGTVTKMSGKASYVANISLADGGIASSGEAVLGNVGFVAQAATVQGLDGTVRLSSLLPPRTRGPQTLKVKMLEAGVPLDNGVVIFELTDAGLRLIDATWPFAGGKLVLVSSSTSVTAADARFDLSVENVDLAALFDIVDVPGLSATGHISGHLPIAIRDGDPILLDGEMAAQEKGVIIYKGAGSEIAPSEETKLLTDALRNFHYTELTGGLSGNANGDLVLRLGLKGANPDLYEGYPFAINVKLEGSLADVLRRGTVGFRPLELIRDHSNQAVTPPADKLDP